MYCSKNRNCYLALLFALLTPLSVQAIGTKTAEDEGTRIDAYDPFADYSEFENTAEEQENIHFFQTGRFLTLGPFGGTRIFTQNLAQLYQIGPAFGGYLNYFFDLHFAIRFGVAVSISPLSLQTANNVPFIGEGNFLSMGVDFMYFLDKNLFSNNLSWLQPYFFIGGLSSQVSVLATFSTQPGAFEDSGFGVNAGLGLEFQFHRKIYSALEYSFQYVTLEQEAVPLELITPGGTQSVNFRPYGDWMNVYFLLGVIF